MKKLFILFALCFFICAFSEAFAYTPSPSVKRESEELSKRLGKYLDSKSSIKRAVLLKTLTTALPTLQLSQMKKGNIEKAYQFEYVRRHLPGVEIIDTEGVLDDDQLGITWTHAPKGFDVMYFPYETPPIGQLGSDDEYSILLNGGYFKRTEWGTYHAGVLYLGWYRQTPFESQDPQLTHIACIDDHGYVVFWTNSAYLEERLPSCKTAFQSGPMIYADVNGETEQNLMPKTYLWLPHTRTVMVVMNREDESQDIWFLTAYEDKTLAQIRDIVLSETRFYGEYKDLYVFNLDGGSSVAYVTNDFPELNFWSSKKLPVVFGIK